MDERLVNAVQGWRPAKSDPDFEIDFAAYLRRSYDQTRLVELYERFVDGADDLDALIRRAIWRSMTRSFGHGVTISPGARFRHIETFEIGDAVYIGRRAMLWGSLGGVCRIGNHVWIGPRVYFDARNLVVEDYVSWGPGARVHGPDQMQQLGDPAAVQVGNQPVVVKRGADIGAAAIILPGVTIGERATIAEGVVISGDVAANGTIVAVPLLPGDPSQDASDQLHDPSDDVDDFFRRATQGDG